MMLLLSTGRSECQQYSRRLRKPLLVHRTVGIMLEHLKCYTYILFMVIFALADLRLVGICLFVCSLLLAITIITAYLITSNGCAPR